MKLNIGSAHPRGKYRSKPWINIDVAPVKFENVIQMDALDMSFEDNSFDEVHAVHCLEHVNRNYRRKFIEECYRVVAPGCKVYIEVPNFLEVVRLLHEAYERNNERAIHIWTTSIFGKQRYPGDQHCWGFSPQSLADLMCVVGFELAGIYSNEQKDHMISTHYKQEPVILAVGKK